MIRTSVSRAVLAVLLASSLASCGPAEGPRPGAVARAAVIAGLTFAVAPPAWVWVGSCVELRVATTGTTGQDTPLQLSATAGVHFWTAADCTGTPVTEVTVPGNSDTTGSFWMSATGTGEATIRAEVQGAPGIATSRVFSVAETSLAFATQPPPSVSAGVPFDVAVTLLGVGPSGPLTLQACDRVTGAPCVEVRRHPSAGFPSTQTLTATLGTASARWQLVARGPNGEVATSDEFAVVPGTPRLTMAPLATQRAGVAFPSYRVSLVDDWGNPVSTSVTVALRQGPSRLLGTTSLVSDGAGHADFVDLVVTAVGTHELQASTATALSVPVAFSVVPGAAVVTFLDAPTAAVEAGQSMRFVVSVKDAHGNAHPERVSLRLENAAHGRLESSSALPTAGIVDVSLSVQEAGAWSLGASLADDYGSYVATTGPFTIVAAPADTVRFVASPPPSIAAGAAFGATVRVLDAYSNPVPTTVTLALASSNGATLGGVTAATTDAAGDAAFDGLSVERAGEGYRLAASLPSSGRTAETGAFAVTAGVPVLTVLAPAGELSADASFAVTVLVADAYRNPVDGPVALSLAPEGAATLAGTVVQPTAGGVASFPGLAVRKAGGPYRLVASRKEAVAASGPDFSVAPGVAASLPFVDFTATVGLEGVALPALHVAVEDAWANLVTSTGPVALDLAAAPQGAALGGSATAAPVLGVATFTGVTLAPAGTYRLRARLGELVGLAPAETTVLAPGSNEPAHHLAFTETAAHAIQVGTCAGPFQVDVLDAGGPYTPPRRLSMSTPVALDLAQRAGLTFYADVGCDATPITTTEIGLHGRAEFRVKAGQPGAFAIAVYANLTGQNGSTAGVKSAVHELSVTPGSPGGDEHREEKPSASPLNGWSTGCGAAGGAPSSAALLGALAVLLLPPRRRARGAMAALAVAAAALPGVAAGEPPGRGGGRVARRAREGAMAAVPTATATPTAPPSAPPTATAVPASGSAPPSTRRARDTRPAVAVLTVESSVQGESLDTAALTDLFAAALDAPRWFRIVAPRDVTAALALERQKLILGCSSDSSCLAELAGALGVELVAAASVGRVRDSLVVSARLIEARHGTAVARSSRSADPEQLVGAVADAARDLLDGYRGSRPADEQARLVVPERGAGAGTRFTLRLGGVAGYAPGAADGARGSAGGELGVAWRMGGRWSLVVAGVAGPNPGFRLGVMRRLTGGAFRLSAGLRGAGWPGAGAYGGGAALEAAVALGRRVEVFAGLSGEGYAAAERYGAYAVLGGIGIALRL